MSTTSFIAMVQEHSLRSAFISGDLQITLHISKQDVMYLRSQRIKQKSVCFIVYTLLQSTWQSIRILSSTWWLDFKCKTLFGTTFLDRATECASRLYPLKVQTRPVGKGKSASALGLMSKPFLEAWACLVLLPLTARAHEQWSAQQLLTPGLLNTLLDFTHWKCMTGGSLIQLALEPGPALASCRRVLFQPKCCPLSIKHFGNS